MRSTVFALAAEACALAVFALGCGIEQLTQGGGHDAAAAAASSDAGADAAKVTGKGCGVEVGSGAELCATTSACPNVTVDVQAFPHCGFRIKGSSTELVCGCGDAICSMGPYTSCAQAASLLSSQIEAHVCTQVSEGRCTVQPAPASTSSGSTCDRACLKDCGGGAGCASICGC